MTSVGNPDSTSSKYRADKLPTENSPKFKVRLIKPRTQQAEDLELDDRGIYWNPGL